MNSGGDLALGLLFLTMCLLFYVCLCVLGCAARRATTLPRRLIFALVPILAGLIGVLARIPCDFWLGSFHLRADVGWLFIVPLISGIAGLFGVRPEPVV
jgi:hypothetical protein